MELKCGSGNGVVRSYQVLSKVQGEAGYECEGISMYGGAWGCLEVQRSWHASITGHLTSITATAAAAPHPCRWFRIQECWLTARGIGFTARSRPCTQDFSHACSPFMRRTSFPRIAASS